MILVGSLITTGFFTPSLHMPFNYLTLDSTLQLPALLLCALVAGPRAGVIASIAYITIGLFYLPVFQGGGGINYLSSPSFGYLIAFIPTAWISGNLAHQSKMNTFLRQTFCAISGLLFLHAIGIISLIIRSASGTLANQIQDYIYKLSIVPLPTQIILCPAIGLIALIFRALMIIE